MFYGILKRMKKTVQILNGTSLITSFVLGTVMLVLFIIRSITLYNTFINSLTLDSDMINSLYMIAVSNFVIMAFCLILSIVAFVKDVPVRSGVTLLSFWNATLSVICSIILIGLVYFFNTYFLNMLW